MQESSALSTGPHIVPFRKQATVFVIAFLATYFGGIVSMLMSVYLPVVVRDLLGEVSADNMNSITAWVNAVFIFGWMFGGMAWGVVCDRIGRKQSVALSIGCYAIFTLLTGFAPTWVLLSACRFFSGFGIGGVLVTTTILVAEVFPERRKAIMQGMVSLAMPVGFFTAGIINNITEDWRAACTTGFIPLALAVLAAVVLPESTLWHRPQAGSSTKRVTVQSLPAHAYRSNLVTGAVVFGAMLIGLWATFSWTPTWIQGIAPAEDAQQLRGTTMMILAGGGILGSFASGWIVNAIGMRKTMMLCFIACFVMTFVVFRLNTAVTPATFIEMAVLVFFFGISQGALAVYIPALFPPEVCATATGFCFNAGRLFTGSVVFFIGALEAFFGGYGNAVIAFSVVFIIGLIAVGRTSEKSFAQLHAAG